MTLAIACAGCRAGENEPGDETSRRPELDCEQDGYPCSLAEVDMSVLLASDSLATDMAERVAGGAPAESAVVALEGRDDVIDVLADDGMIMFRLEGGRPTWVVSPDLFEGEARGGADAGFAVPPTARARGPRSAIPAVPAAPRIVGADRQNRRDKRALVLSPYAWDFEPWDEGNEVTTLLSDVRGYESGVDFYSNPNATDANIRWSQWIGWGAYDVVHVSTHGWQRCLNIPGRAGCHSAILTAIPLASFNIPMGTTPAGTNAVYWTHRFRGGPYREYSLTQDFFRLQYPGGLEDTIVFFNACQTTMAPQIIRALSGAATSVVGWDQVTLSSDAQPAALTFFQRLDDYGETTAEAHAAVVKAGLSVSTTRKYGRANLTHNASGALRIRETVWLRDPVGGAEVLDDASLMIDGAVGDGLDDRLPITFQVDGIQPGRVREYVPHLAVNGVEVRETFDLTKGRQIDQDTWVVTDTASLWFDVVKGHQANLDVWLDLPEGGDTRVEALDVELVGSNITYSGYRTGEFHDSLVASAQVLPNINSSVNPGIACLATFSMTDNEGRHLLIVASLTGPLGVRGYPISGPVQVPAMSPEGTPYTMLEQPLDVFAVEGTNPPGPEWFFRARGTGGSLTVHSISPTAIGFSFVAHVEFDGNPITYRGRVVAPLDGLSNFADIGDGCVIPGP